MDAAIRQAYGFPGILGEGQTSPQRNARAGGLLYLIIIVGGLVGEAFVRGRLLVLGDATATAERIVSSELLWRASIAGEFFMLVCTIALAVIFYGLFRPVDRGLARLAVFLNLIAVAIEGSNELNLVATLSLLENAEYLRVFSPEQLHALAHLPVTSYAYGFGAGLIFFGCECLVLGYLIVRSGFLPKTVGALMLIAGLCYLTNSFALILSPTLESWLFPAIVIPAFVGEASLCGWLLVKGVNVPRWNARASVQETGQPWRFPE